MNRKAVRKWRELISHSLAAGSEETEDKPWHSLYIGRYLKTGPFRNKPELHPAQLAFWNEAVNKRMFVKYVVSDEICEEVCVCVSVAYRTGSKSSPINPLKPTGHVMHQQFNIQ